MSDFKQYQKRVVYILVLLFLVTLLGYCTSGNVKAEINVCGADDNCVNVTLYNFCHDTQETPPNPRDFVARLFDVTTVKFVDNIMTVQEITGNNIIYETTFSNLINTHIYQVMVHYNNQQWTPWTDQDNPPFDVTWNVGEYCLKYKNHLPLVINK